MSVILLNIAFNIIMYLIQYVRAFVPTVFYVSYLLRQRKSAQEIVTVYV